MCISSPNDPVPVPSRDRSDLQQALKKELPKEETKNLPLTGSAMKKLRSKSRRNEDVRAFVAELAAHPAMLTFEPLVAFFRNNPLNIHWSDEEGAEDPEDLIEEDEDDDGMSVNSASTSIVNE